MQVIIILLIIIIFLCLINKSTYNNNYEYHNQNVIRLYENTDKFWHLVNDKGKLWKNLGIINNKNNISYSTACENLALLLAEKAKLNKNSIIMDAGCGYGIQDLLWSKKYKVKKIDAVSITPVDISIANKYYKNSKINYFCQDACILNNFPKNSYTHILSLESAFHFNTREMFLQEAYNLLKKGGVLAIADVITTQECDASKLWQVPKNNIYSKKVYHQILKNIGYQNIKFECISDKLFIKNVTWSYIISTCIKNLKYIDWSMLKSFYKVLKMRNTQQKYVEDGYYIITAIK